MTQPVKNKYAWLECKVRPGMFPSERNITVHDTNDVLIGSAWVDATLIKDNVYVKVIVMTEEAARVLVYVSGGFAVTPSIWVPRKKVHFIKS